MEKEYYKLDRNAFSIVDSFDDESDKQYWWSKTPVERLEFVEYFRILNYGVDEIKSRIQRVLEFVKPE